MQHSSSRFNWGSIKARLDEISKADSTHLSEQAINDILLKRAARYRNEENHAQEDIEEMIFFEEAGTRYAIPLHMLSEIRPAGRMTALPLVKQHILGLVNFRGKIVAIYSLAQCINQAVHNSADQKTGSILIGHGIAAHMAIFADNVVGTANIKSSDIHAPPISLCEYDYITGIGSDGLIFLNMEKLVKNTHFYLA